MFKHKSATYLGIVFLVLVQSETCESTIIYTRTYEPQCNPSQFVQHKYERCYVCDQTKSMIARSYIIENKGFAFTVRLLHSRRHAGEKVNRRHVYLVLAVRMRHLNGGEIAKHFVGRRELTHPVLVLDYLLWGASTNRKQANRTHTQRTKQRTNEVHNTLGISHGYRLIQ